MSPRSFSAVAKRIVTAGLATCVVLAVGVAANPEVAIAAPPRGVTPDGPRPGAPGPGPKRLVRTPGSFAARMNNTVTKGGQSLTRQQILAKFDPDSSVDLDAGTKITVQDLLDRIEESEKEVATKGGSLTRLKKTAWLRATTPQKLGTQHSMVVTELRQVETNKPKMSTMNVCDVVGCTPKDKEKSIRWDNQKGDEDTIAIYSSFGITEQTPDVDHARCTATWDNGIHLMGKKQSLVKLTAEAAGQKTPTVSSSGKVALYVLGQATPTWSKEGKVAGDVLDRTFRSPKVSLAIDFIPLVSVEGGIQGAATLSLRPSVAGSADAGNSGCSVQITPRLTADVAPEVRIIVGVRKLLELAKGGVKAEITVLDLSLPSSLDLKMGGRSGQLRLKSDVNATFLKGKLVAWYKIKDVCAWGYCLIEDGLGIDTSGEVELWEDAQGIGFATNLVNIDGPIPFQPAGRGGMLLSQ